MPADPRKPIPVPAGARLATQQGSQFYLVGEKRELLRDVYHTLMRLRWSITLGLIAAAFLALNVLFAIAYLVVGGVQGSSGSFFDALAFSVETFGTIGYGTMYPASTAANTLMIVQSIVSLIFTALATGLVFTKFSRPTTRIGFSKYAVITQHEGKRTLIFRAGNRRSNVIVEATIHVVAVYTTVTSEGETFYRAIDLPMVRDRQVGMTRGWTLMHVIDEKSPFHGADAKKLAEMELELYIALTGIDDTMMQSVHAVHMYHDDEIRLEHRFVDTVIPTVDGRYVVDMRNFDRVVPDSTPRDSVPA